MVLSDPFREADRVASSHFRSPLLIDRLAAFAIDWFCFTFLALLVLAPIKRNLMIAKILEREDEFFFSYSLAFVIFFCLALLYNTVFLAWKGATPGKLILRLRVVNVWNQGPLTFTAALVRSLGWCLSALALFLPHAEIFTNGRRRAFYDRLSDSEVVSLSGRYSDQPSLSVVRLAKTIALSFAILVTSFLAADVYRYVRVDGEMQKWREELMGVSPNSCAQVTDAQEDWPGLEGQSRLSVALALYSGNNLEGECLAIEAFRAFQSGDEVELAYLAKSFLHSDDADLSDEYLQKVCAEKENSEACDFSKMIELWANENLPEASKKFQGLLEGGSTYVKVWAIKHFERVKDFATELTLLDELWKIKGLTNFVSTHRGVAYWGLHRRDEARVAITTAISQMEGSQRLEVSSWFCYRELADGCTAIKSPPCDAFLDSSEEMIDRFTSSGHLLTYLRTKECHSGNFEYDEIYTKAPDEQGVRFVQAVQDIRENRIQDALEVLKPILYDENWDRAYKDEALRRLVSIVERPSELKEIADIWAQGEPTSWEWRMQGVSLLRELLSRKISDLALAVGAQLAREKSLPEEDRKSLAMFAYNNGDRKFAFNLIQQNTRAPASEGQESNSNYEEIYHSLYQEFGK